MRTAIGNVLALNQNEDLQNVRGTKFLREMRVPGILRTGRGEGRLASVKTLRDALGMPAPKKKIVAKRDTQEAGEQAPLDS